MTIIVVEVKTAADVDTFSKQDPFVVVTYQDEGEKKTFQTSTKDEAGKVARWGTSAMSDNSISEIIVNDFGAEVKFAVSDEETSGSREIGTTYADFAALCFNGGLDQWFKLWKGNKTIGTIRIISEFTPSKDFGKNEDIEAKRLEIEEVQAAIEEAKAATVEDEVAEVDIADLIKVLTVNDDDVTIQALGHHYGHEGPLNTLK